MRWAVLVGGTGSNLLAMLQADVPVSLVISHRREVPALAIAAHHKIVAHVLDAKAIRDRERYDEELRNLLTAHQIEAIAMAGYMRWLTEKTVKAYRGRVVNVHPSLLPAFPGLHAVDQAYRHGVRWTGVTIHFVDEGQDTGPIIMQMPVPIRPGESLESLEAKIHAAEHRLYPEIVWALERGWIHLSSGGEVLWDLSQKEVESWMHGLYSV